VVATVTAFLKGMLRLGKDGRNFLSEFQKAQVSLGNTYAFLTVRTIFELRANATRRMIRGKENAAPVGVQSRFTGNDRLAQELLIYTILINQAQLHLDRLPLGGCFKFFSWSFIVAS